MNRLLLLGNLNQHKPKSIQSNSKFAAVAIIVFANDKNCELFLIKRTDHPNDPWSGQIGLPGGHHESTDKDLVETSIRETQEETKITLTRDHLVGQIDDQQGYAQGGQINLTVRPFVFIVDQKPVEIMINYELDQYFWMPVSHFQQPGNHIYFDPMRSTLLRPGVRIDEANTLWGMTYRIMADFFTALQHESIFTSDERN